MKAVLVVAVVLLGLIALGWIGLQFTSNSATINVDTPKIQQDTQHAVEQGKEVFRDAKEELNQRTEPPPQETDRSPSP